MCMNKPSATKIEAIERVNLLHSTSYSFEQYKSSKFGHMLVSLPRYAPLHDSHQKTLTFRHRN